MKTVAAIAASVETVVRGKHEQVLLALVPMIAGGHLLLQDVPGVGKSTLAQALGQSIGASYSRIQFTSDLLPADILGVNVFEAATGEFRFRRGPIFANVVMADEINRASPKTQSALLEAMNDRRISIDGTTWELPDPFFVIATQNPVDYHGTYPLPEGQLDRFLMSVGLGYPSRDDERDIVVSQQLRHPVDALKPVMHTNDVLAAQAAVRRVTLSEPILDYALKIVAATRQSNDLALGASPRGTLALTHTAQGFAAIRGRDYVLPDDVKAVATAVLSHRVYVKPKLRTGDAPARAIIQAILDAIPVPVAG